MCEMSWYDLNLGLVAQLVGCIIQGSWVLSLVMPTVACGIISLGKMLTWTVPLSTQE